MMSPAARSRRASFARVCVVVVGALATLCALPARAHAQAQPVQSGQVFAPYKAVSDISVFAPYVAVTSGGDTRNDSATFGFSTAYIEESGWGAEFDLGYVTDFNDIDFESTAIVTAMVNLVAAPRVTRMIRPFGIVGIGLIRARGCGGPNCVTEFSRTDLGLDAGGGAYVHFNDIWAIRGDLRYFRYAQIHQDLPRTSNGQFDFWRFGVAGVYTW
jgi:opacity protein-like surface antigen